MRNKVYIASMFWNYSNVIIRDCTTVCTHTLFLQSILGGNDVCRLHKFSNIVMIVTDCSIPEQYYCKWNMYSICHHFPFPNIILLVIVTVCKCPVRGWYNNASFIAIWFAGMVCRGLAVFGWSYFSSCVGNWDLIFWVVDWCRNVMAPTNIWSPVDKWGRHSLAWDEQKTIWNLVERWHCMS